MSNMDIKQIEWLAGEYSKLKGCTITGIAQDGSDEEADYSTCIGLVCERKVGAKKEKFIAWVQSDEEGNGRGFLSIEKHA